MLSLCKCKTGLFLHSLHCDIRVLFSQYTSFCCCIEGFLTNLLHIQCKNTNIYLSVSSDWRLIHSTRHGNSAKFPNLNMTDLDLTGCLFCALGANSFLL